MAKHLIMDQTGHSTIEFNPANRADLAKAEARFNALMKRGMTPAVLKPDGHHQVTRTFDPTAEQTLFIPQLKGG